jgi:hypothetical protein
MLMHKHPHPLWALPVRCEAKAHMAPRKGATGHGTDQATRHTERVYGHGHMQALGTEAMRFSSFSHERRKGGRRAGPSARVAFPPPLGPGPGDLAGPGLPSQASTDVAAPTN